MSWRSAIRAVEYGNPKAGGAKAGLNEELVHNARLDFGVVGDGEPTSLVARCGVNVWRS